MVLWLRATQTQLNSAMSAVSVVVTRGYFGEECSLTAEQILARQGREPEGLFELLDDNTPVVKAYFDIDERTLPRNDFPIDRIISTLSLVLFGDCDIAPLLVCTSSGEYEGSFKHSYHINYAVSASREVWKEVADRTNKVLTAIGLPACIDNKVYKRRQLWRMIYHHKRNDNRIKKPLPLTWHGDQVSCIIKSWVSYLGDCRPYVHDRLLTTQGFDRIRTCRSRALSEDYDKWVLYGMALSYQCAVHRLGWDVATVEFVSFSRLAVNPATSTEIVSKFARLLKTPVEHDLLDRLCVEVNSTEDAVAEVVFDMPVYLTQYVLITCLSKTEMRRLIAPLLPPSMLPYIIAGAGDVKKAYAAIRHGLLICENEDIRSPYIRHCDSDVNKQICMSLGYVFEAAQFYKEIALYLNTDEEFIEQNKEKEKEVQKTWATITQLLQQHCPDEATEVCAQLNQWLMPLQIGQSRANTIVETMYSWKDKPLYYVTQYPYYSLAVAMADRCSTVEQFRFLLNRCLELVFEAEKVFHFVCFISSEQELAKVCFDLYPCWMLKDQQLYVYDDTSGMWSNDANVQYMILARFMPLAYQYLLKGPRMLAKNFISCTTTFKHILFRMATIPQVQANCVTQEHMKATSEGKLLFPNGYYDGMIDVFYPCIDPSLLELPRYIDDGRLLFTTPHLYFFAAVPDKWFVIRDPEVLEEKERMKRVLFYAMHGKEVGDYHMESLACALFGLKYKGFYIHVGETNSGKSTEKSLLEATFGNYIGSGNTDDFAIVKDDRREAAIINAPAYENWYRRLVLYSERSERLLSSEMLKSYSSGGEDRIRARTQYKSAVSFSIHFVMVFYVNDMLRVSNPDDPAFIDRVRCFYWSKSFVPAQSITQPAVQLPANDEVRLWKNDPQRRMLYCQIIIDAFRAFVARGARLPVPSSVALTTTQQVGTVVQTEELFERLMHELLFTGNPEDIVLREHLSNICNKFQLTLNKLTMKLNSTCSTLGITTIGSKQKKIRGAKQQVWYGVRLRNDLMCLNETSPLVDYNQWLRLMRAHNNVLSSQLIDDLYQWRQWTESHPLYPFLTPAQLMEMGRRVRPRLNHP